MNGYYDEQEWKVLDLEEQVRTLLTDRESQRQLAERSASEVARLAARCEGLEKLLRSMRDDFEGLPRSLGYASTHLPAIDAALSPPASDATDSADGETK